MPKTRIVSVMDREADFFELFDEHRKDPRVDLLVRAMYNRNTATDGVKLFDAARKAPVCKRTSIKIPRQSARPKRSKQKARPARRERVADCAVRYARVELKAPDYPGQQGKAPISVCIIHLVEEAPPPGVKRLEWFLITTMDIRSADQVIECVNWYCKRWRIEDWHRVLKSGCRIEEAAHEKADRLRRAIAINLVGSQCK